MSALAPTLQAYFTDRLISQRAANPEGPSPMATPAEADARSTRDSGDQHL